MTVGGGKNDPLAIMAGGFLWPENKKAGQERDKMTDSRKRKRACRLFESPQALVFVLVPEVGIEPT